MKTLSLCANTYVELWCIVLVVQHRMNLQYGSESQSQKIVYVLKVQTDILPVILCKMWWVCTLLYVFSTLFTCNLVNI